ncbi:MAG TPA: peptidoglycan-binding domain-containing protein [Magnetospirillaceae bacterium]|jgi:murein L,D-transpeptidase YcbB/YkuD
MRNLSSALTMGLIIAATSGLVAAYAFAADSTSGANPATAPAQAAQPANNDAGTAPATNDANSAGSNAATPATNNGTGNAGSSNAGTSAAPMNQDDNKANNAAAPNATPNNTNATQDQNGQSGQATTPDANDKMTQSQSQHSSKKHMAMSRKHIESVQAALANSGQSVAIDGVWGPKTTAALKDFQKAHGLKATGRLNHATREALPKST